MKLIPRDFDLFSSPFDGFGSLMSVKHPMSTDIVEDGENLKIIMDLPGVKKENVKISQEMINRKHRIKVFHLRFSLFQPFQYS